MIKAIFPAELIPVMTESVGYLALQHEGILAVTGPDATRFLQGQITNNLNYLTPELSGLGARCTAKGRMISSFRVIKRDDNCYWLIIASELLEAQLADLKKYAVFSKVELNEITDQWQRYGLLNGFDSLDEAPATTNRIAAQSQGFALRLDAQRIEWWLPSNTPQPDKLTKLEAISQNDWFAAQIEAGIGQVFGATREVFIPQMINLQALDGVSFRKGCYTGQEIVARMQYLGKLKRRMYRFKVDGVSTPNIGAPIYSPTHSSSVGEVVLAAQVGDYVELLAVAQEEAVSDQRITLTPESEQYLQLLALPYTCDSDREIQR